jgi:hypothetical protein
MPTANAPKSCATAQMALEQRVQRVLNMTATCVYRALVAIILLLETPNAPPTRAHASTGMKLREHRAWSTLVRYAQHATTATISSKKDRIMCACRTKNAQAAPLKALKARLTLIGNAPRLGIAYPGNMSR